MKATELQLEDLVMYNKCVWRVYCLSMPFPRNEDRYNNKAVITLWGNGFIDTLEEEIDPIPLTTEILLKNGFRCYHKYKFSSPIYYVHKCGIKYNVSGNIFYTDSLDLNIDLKYVHQLQHLLRLCGLNELADSIII